MNELIQKVKENTIDNTNWCDDCSNNDAGECHTMLSSRFGQDVSGEEACEFYEGV